MRRILKKAAAVVSSLLLAVSAAGSAGTLIGGASQAPVLTMSLLAGGDAVGIQFRLKQASTDNSTYSVYLDGEQQTLTDGKFLVVAEKATDFDQTMEIEIRKGSTTVGDVKEISVLDYLNRILEDDNQEDYHNTAQAMIDYCHAAQWYFGLRTDYRNFLPNYAALMRKVPAVPPFTDEDKAKFNADLADQGIPLSYYGMNLSLYGRMTFNLFFKALTEDADELAAAFDDFTYTGSTAAFSSFAEEPDENGFIRVSLPFPLYRFDDGTMLELPGGTEIMPVQYLAAVMSADFGASNALKTLCGAIETFRLAVYDLLDLTEQPETVLEDEPEEETFSGHLTSYGYNVGESTGCMAMDDFVEANSCPVAALTDEYYEKYAGGWIEITYGDKKLNALVADAMPLSSNNVDETDVDLDHTSFESFTGLTNTKVEISWKPIKKPIDCDVQIKLKLGSSTGWTAIQIQGFDYPIASLYDSNGTFTRMRTDDADKLFCGYFIREGSYAANSLTFTAVDVNGKEYTITGNDVDLSAQLGADTLYDCTVTPKS